MLETEEHNLERKLPGTSIYVSLTMKTAFTPVIRRLQKQEANQAQQPSNHPSSTQNQCEEMLRVQNLGYLALIKNPYNDQHFKVITNLWKKHL